MANRRMFSKEITESDAFQEMPLSSQALYFHICMNSDDDGFCNNPKKIQRVIGASIDDLKLLIAKRFLLAFENGVVVVKHWRMHNQIRKDRYNPTVYQDCFQQLVVKTNGAYTDDTKWLPDGCQVVVKMETQARQGKVRLGKDSIDKIRLDKASIEDLLQPNELEFLEQNYEDIDILFECINRRGKLDHIKSPLNYVVKIANEEGWKTK